ncbi:hypothetical protein HanIR_Chr07g0334571 [Helianthus annuus]|nr:hypothetical protein HanIR_Chr07g0334571 [Helianthus annuus]
MFGTKQKSNTSLDYLYHSSCPESNHRNASSDQLSKPITTFPAGSHLFHTAMTHRNNF